jgi:putative hydrolase of the HAD superfamily
MIKNLIFDFGGVLINLDMDSVPRGLSAFNRPEAAGELMPLAQQYEKGLVSTESFLEGVQQAIPGIGRDEVQRIWNGTVADFPPERQEFISRLNAAGAHRMFLLSNTNALHISAVEDEMGPDRFAAFRRCFEGFYLSHELGMRKPDREIFEYVLTRHGLQAEETLFIDDTREHTLGAAGLGIRTWHFRVGVDSILDLEKKLL